MRLIDAGALKKKAQMRGHVSKKEMVTVYQMCVSTHDIDEAPTVDAEPVRHGRWVDTEPEYCDCYAKNAHVCSECHDFYTLNWKYMNYCPHCGAKMDEEVQ